MTDKQANRSFQIAVGREGCKAARFKVHSRPPPKEWPVYVLPKYIVYLFGRLFFVLRVWQRYATAWTRACYV